MKVLPLAVLMLLATWAAASAEQLIVSRPTLQVRQEPRANARAIEIVYGNDTFEILAEQEGWYQVKTTRNRLGWVPAAAVMLQSTPIAEKSLLFANHLRQTGRQPLARAKFFEIVQRYPDTKWSYEATRHLLYYYPVAKLPEPEGEQVTPEMQAQAGEVLALLYVEEGRQRLKEGRYTEAVPMFEDARVRGKVNRTAMVGIGKALLSDLREAKAQGDLERERVTRIAIRDYFPNYDRLKAQAQTLAKQRGQSPEMAEMAEPETLDVDARNLPVPEDAQPVRKKETEKERTLKQEPPEADSGAGPVYGPNLPEAEPSQPTGEALDLPPDADAPQAQSNEAGADAAQVSSGFAVNGEATPLDAPPPPPSLGDLAESPAGLATSDR